MLLVLIQYNLIKTIKYVRNSKRNIFYFTVNKFKSNNSEIVPVGKSNSVIITHINDIYGKTLDFINNNNIQT